MSLTDAPNIPPGYRQGFITATTVLLTASLLYFRYAALESGSGDWTPWGVVSVVILSMSICIQLYTLWRALQPDDEVCGRSFSLGSKLCDQCCSVFSLWRE